MQYAISTYADTELICYLFQTLIIHKGLLEHCIEQLEKFSCRWA
jgi:hypothetical protein